MNHIAAIHVLKAQLKLSEGDYRALLAELTGKDSCKAMHATQLAKVRSHLDNLAVRMGVATPKYEFKQPKDGWQAHKIEQLWVALGQLGALTDPSPAGLRKFIESKSIKAVSSARFLSAKEASNMTEALKSWLARAQAKQALSEH